MERLMVRWKRIIGSFRPVTSSRSTPTTITSGGLFRSTAGRIFHRRYASGLAIRGPLRGRHAGRQFYQLPQTRRSFGGADENLHLIDALSAHGARHAAVYVHDRRSHCVHAAGGQASIRSVPARTSCTSTHVTRAITGWRVCSRARGSKRRRIPRINERGSGGCCQNKGRKQCRGSLCCSVVRVATSHGTCVPPAVWSPLSSWANGMVRRGIVVVVQMKAMLGDSPLGIRPEKTDSIKPRRVCPAPILD